MDTKSICISYSLDDDPTEAYLWMHFPLRGELGFKLPETIKIIGNDSKKESFTNFIENIKHKELESLLQD